MALLLSRCSLAFVSGNETIGSNNNEALFAPKPPNTSNESQPRLHHNLHLHPQMQHLCRRRHSGRFVRRLGSICGDGNQTLENGKMFQF
jgi:hypothetical protein